MLARSLILLLIVEDGTFQKSYYKKYTLISFVFSNFTMILILLTKVVIFYIQVTIVQVGISRHEDLDKFAPGSCLIILNLLNISLYNLPGLYLDKKRNRYWCRSWKGVRKSKNGKTYIKDDKCTWCRAL